jgi:putative SOS response-associated peptidase YedK
MWKSPEGEEIHTCCIITTDANTLMAPIHDRMPVILPQAHYSAWLDPSNGKVDELKNLLRPSDPSTMRAYPVRRAVNASRTDSPDLIDPA